MHYCDAHTNEEKEAKVEIKKRHIESEMMTGNFWVIVNASGQRLSKVFDTKREAKWTVKDLEAGRWCDLATEEEGV